MPDIDSKKFDRRIETIVDDDNLLDKYYDKKDAWYRKKCNTKMFMDEFFKILGLNTSLRMLPHFMRTIDSKRHQLLNELDKIYLSEIKKLPVKYPNMLN